MRMHFPLATSSQWLEFHFHRVLFAEPFAEHRTMEHALPQPVEATTKELSSRSQKCEDEVSYQLHPRETSVLNYMDARDHLDSIRDLQFRRLALHPLKLESL
jgi:hypothetical protein